MASVSSTIRAVLFDRDGTLIEDVPYNGDPARVVPMPQARSALERLREAGIRIGMISNQSGIGRGLISHRRVRAVNRRLVELVGGLDVVLYCPHVDADHCGCRKPQPGLVHRACEQLGIPPSQTVVVGDIEADMVAARRAGARGVLVPTPWTLPDEVGRAQIVAADLTTAVDVVLMWRTPPGTDARGVAA